jgi:hypothetical protein
MNSSKLMALILAVSAVTVAMLVAGCTTPTPTPAPTATPSPSPSPSPAPTMSPVDREYQFVERLSVGINDYNTGVGFVTTAKNLFNQSDYTNASQYMKMAGDRMDVAKGDFTAMRTYASTLQEVNLSNKWMETAELYSKSYHNASEAYSEYGYQMSRPAENRNYVKYDYYVQQANYYNAVADESRKQADAILKAITFVVPTAVP